MCQLAESD